MAIVSGVREKVHLPIYDCLKVKAGEQLGEAEKTSTLKFFVDVQGKTKLETNLQSASLLPHYNTFEARAMRVVVSDLPPEFTEDAEVEFTELEVLDTSVDPPIGAVDSNNNPVTATVRMDLARAMNHLEDARDSDEDQIELDPEDLDEGVEVEVSDSVTAQRAVVLTTEDIESSIEDHDKAPPREQLRPGNGSGTILSKFIYNTVTTLYVGEKVMVEAPTWLFPSGAGPYSERGTFATHGEPNPLATFRFAEPIYIDKQQNFRVEIEVPDTDVLREIRKIYGPMFIWVVLDGYMTRGVQ